MLVKIREKSKGIVAYFLVGLIAIAFSLWGMDSLFESMRGDPNEVGRVNKASISEYEVDRLVQQLQMQNQLDTNQIDMQRLRQFALGQLIEQQLLNQASHKLNMHISDRQLERQLVRLSVFQDEDGRFQQENFTQLLRQEGLSPQMFRQQFKQDLLNQQILTGLANSEFSLSKELKNFQQLVGQKRSYNYKIFANKDFLNQVKISSEEIEDFYQEHQNSFLTPAQLKLNYVLFDPASLEASISLSQEQLEDEYQRYVAALEASSNNYEAAHILLEFSSAQERKQALEKLEDARAQIEAGASFADLAAEISSDLSTAQQGGNLGRIQPGSLDAKFEEALFALENPGDVSAVVETSFGLHLIQLVDKDLTEVPSFESMQEELKQKALVQPLREAVNSKLEELSNLSFSSENLSEVAQILQLKMQTSPWLQENSFENLGDLADFWQEEAVQQAVFNADVIEEGWLTEPIQLADGRYLVAEKNEYQPQEQQSLEQVEKLIRQELQMRQAADLAQAAAEKASQDLTEQPQESASLQKQGWQLAQEVGRSNHEQNIEINLAAFRLSTQKPVDIIALSNGDAAVIQLLEIKPGQVSQNPSEQRQLAIALQENSSRKLIASLMLQLEQQAKIQVR